MSDDGLTPGRRYYLKNKELVKQRSRDRYYANRESILKQVVARYDPSRAREGNLRRKFGITNKQYDSLLANQDCVCAICGQPETRTRNGYTLPLAVDHDHHTGKVRGLLCGSCNQAIGDFKDNCEIIERAIAYVRGHNE